MPGTRTVRFHWEQYAMETGQTSWAQGSVLAHSTSEAQAARLATAPTDEIAGVYTLPMAANASSNFAPDVLPQVDRVAYGVPVLCETGTTIAINDKLVASSVTAGGCRTAAPGEKPFGRAHNAVSSASAGALVLADLFIGDFEPLAEVVGTAATGVTAVEAVSSHSHRTTLTVATTLPAITGGANQGVGVLLYTFPAGDLVVNVSKMDLAITQTEGNINADTPDVGLGTVIATGAVAVLSGTATFENIITGQTATDCNGTATTITLAPTAGSPFVIQAAEAHTIHFNAADGWAASGDAAATVTGTVVLEWNSLT